MGNAQGGTNPGYPGAAGGSALDDILDDLGDMLNGRPPRNGAQPAPQLIPIPIPVDDRYPPQMPRGQPYPDNYGRGQGGYYGITMEQQSDDIVGSTPKKVPLFNIQGLNNNLRLKQQQMGDALQGISENIQSGLENLPITGEQVKQIGQAVAIPIIASTAMGKGVGIFSSRAGQTAVRRAAPRAMRVATASRTGFARIAAVPVKAAPAPMVSPFSTSSLRLQPCLFSPAPQAHNQVHRAASLKLGLQYSSISK